MNISKFIIVLLIFTGSLGSCKTIASEEVFKPIIPNEDLIAFFEEHLPRLKPSIFLECFFFDKEDREDKCIIINSEDEFRKSFSCSLMILPAIDFDSHTLIIGQHQVPCICDYIVEQEIIVKSEEVILNLRWGCPDGSYSGFGTLSYWGLYPKIQAKEISVNIINQ
ncbi:MAG: hypothetical protein LBH91_06375 [Prevotellaceae bacterium]|jgi:hypothetical protein|nr:hypothetical protein [Prevotellaceae bacterium]